MTQKIGKIEKPSIDSFRHARKLFCLPLIPRLQRESIQEDLQNYINLFWQQATKQIADLERTGKIEYILYESILNDQETGIETIK